MKSDDKLKLNFRSNKSLEKCVTDITEIKGNDDKLYVSAIFDCFDVTVLGLAMDTNMKAPLCVATLNNAKLHIQYERMYLPFRQRNTVHQSAL